MITRPVRTHLQNYLHLKARKSDGSLGSILFVHSSTITKAIPESSLLYRYGYSLSGRQQVQGQTLLDLFQEKMRRLQESHIVLP